MNPLNFLQLAISLWAAIGLGGIFGAYFQSRFQHQKEVKEDIHQLKRKRYGSILIQMITILDPERGLSKIKEIRNDLKEIKDCIEEVKVKCLIAFYSQVMML